MEFTDRQKLIIEKSRQLMPDNFSLHTTDEKILMFAEVILADINVWPPLQGFTTESVPEILLPTLYFGVSLFSALFLQMRATLEDFSYNDNGLTVQVDQVGKINASFQNLLGIYKSMITNYKKTQIFTVAGGGKGLGTPRFQSQIGQFLKISLGSAFSWNQP